jgi:putative membrane protein insertion efficiency factor
MLPVKTQSVSTLILSYFFQSSVCCFNGGAGFSFTFVTMFKAILIFFVKGYQSVISPHLPMACRFHPTCSQYMIEAIVKFGPLKGVWLGLKRIGRCHPLGGSGFDPVP